MELLNADLPKNHIIILAGDLHLGTLASHLKGWERMIERVANEPSTYLVLMGDLIEAIAVDDKRWFREVHDADMTPMIQADAIVDSIKPIKKKVLACLTGNHEMKLWRFGDLTRYICDKAEVPYGGYSCKLTVKNKGKRMYKLYVTHGRLTVNSIADDPVRRLSNFRLSIKRKLQHLAGDCAIMATGHAHKLLTLQPEAELYVTDNGEHLQAHYTVGQQAGEYLDPNLRWYACTGSFLKSAVVGALTYSEQSMFAPVQMGYVQANVKDGVIQNLEEVRV